jgi:hypothetical protein
VLKALQGLVVQFLQSRITSSEFLISLSYLPITKSDDAFLPSPHFTSCLLNTSSERRLPALNTGIGPLGANIGA